MTSKQQFETISLANVTGGTMGAPIKPITPMPQGMGFPKYSAGWWDLVRGNGGK
jgi:hypothetical protein